MSWVRGTQLRATSWRPSSAARAIPSRFASTFAWVSSTPRGLPVEPEEYCTKASASGSRAGAPPGSAWSRPSRAKLRGRSTTSPHPSSVRRSRTSPSWSSQASGSWASTPRSFCTCSRVWQAVSGAGTRPPSTQPQNASTNGRGSATWSTTSAPGGTPAASRPPATRRAASRSAR
ncbi:MAG: hypothetical protein R3F62_15135 [Planctomycetota bacterium]